MLQVAQVFQGQQSFQDAVVRIGKVQFMGAIVIEKIRVGGLQKFLASRRSGLVLEGPPHQHQRSVADVSGNLRVIEVLQSKMGQRSIHTVAQVRSEERRVGKE